MKIVDFIHSNARWLFAGGVMTFATCFGQTFFISIFARQIMETYHLTNGEWGTLYAIGTTASGLTMIWLGGYADRLLARTLVTVLLLLMAVFCLLMAFNNSVWLLPVIIFGLRLTGQGMLFHVAMVSMARWYTKIRGKAIAIATLGFSISEAFLPVITIALMSYFLWTQIWIGAAVVSLLFIPLLRKLLRTERTPAAISKSSQAAGMNGHHWTRKEALAHPLFWLLIPAAMTPSTFITAVFFQQVHLAQVNDWAHGQFVALFPAYTATAVLSTLVFGWAVDRWSSIRLLAVTLLPMVIGLLVFANFSSLASALIALMFMAIMQGGYSTASVAFWSETYGTKHVGAIKALATSFMVFGSAIGPIMTGRLIDIGYSFPVQMNFYAVYVLFVFALTFFSVHRFLRK